VKKILQYTLPLLVAGALLWYAYRDTDLQTLGAALGNARFVWIIISIIPITMGHVLRAQRWRMLLAPLGHNPSLYNTFASVMAGYFANLIVPRMGEVTRCAVLNRSEKIPLNESVGTVIVERGLDLATLGLLTSLAFLMEYKQLTDFFMDKIGQKNQTAGTAQGPSYLIWGLALTLVIFAALFFVFRAKIMAHPVAKKILEFGAGLLNGVLSITKMKGTGWFIAHSLLIWASYFITTWLCMLALPETANLGLKAALLILVIGSFGMVAPVQGGIGAYHYMVIAGLTELYAQTSLGAQSFAFLSHTVTTLYVMLVGGVFFVLTLGNAVKTEKI
jgi:glycosyltransferase 2 family protein